MRKQRQNYNTDVRARRLGNRENTSSSSTRDPLRNGEIPLCSLLKDAIEDIFPELNDHRNLNRANLSQRREAQGGSTLGQMIRRRYLRSRKACRISYNSKNDLERINQDYAFEHNNNNSNNNINSNKDDFQNNTTPPTSTTVSKKRRKRKKKKKQDSAAAFPPTIIGDGNTTSAFDTATYSSSRNGMDSHFSDGKSMMSSADHSLEALDEAIKTEAEKMTELQANQERPLLKSLPSDDNIQAQESPSQFIDQIKPQQENIANNLVDHMDQLPLTHPSSAETIAPTLSLPEDNIPGDDESSEIIWQNPLQLSFLVNIEEQFRSSSDETQIGSRNANASIEPQNVTTFISDKERARTLLYEWIDQFFFMNDELECIGKSITKEDQEDTDQQSDWDAFIKFCNERTAGREKAIGIPIGNLYDVGESIECRHCRKDTLAEIKKISENGTGTVSASIPKESSRIILKPTVLEKPIPATDNEIDAAFDYVALEEGHHMPNSAANEEKSDSNLSFLATDVATDPKQRKSTNKNGSKNKNSVGSVATTEQYLWLEWLTSEQLEEFLYEWLIAGVDEDKLVQMSIGHNCGKCRNDTDSQSFPVIASPGEIQTIKKRVTKTQRSFKESANKIDTGLEKMRNDWNNYNHSEVNLDFSEVNLKFPGMMENCEESCHDYFMDEVLPILTGELSLPIHACAKLQVHFWTSYLEVLGNTLNACDSYYNELEALADQNGKLPFHFNSAPFRALYRKFALEKIGFLSEFGGKFSKASTSLSMREFLTGCCWDQFKQEGKKIQSEKLDEDCRDLIIALTEWTKIVNAGRMSVINKERAKRLMTVFDMLRVVCVSLGEEYERVKQHFSQECQKYFARLLSNIHLAHGVKDRMRLIEMNDVVSLTTGVILMWRHVRIIQSHVGPTTLRQVLPLSLRKWAMESSAIGFDLDKSSSGSLHLIESKCLPDIGGRRRTMGILAGLTYVWLRERCKEWKAEIASHELLTYFDTDLLSVADQQPANASKAPNKAGGSSGKSSKKSKKKKNKKSQSLANGSNANPTNSSEENEAIKSSGGILDPPNDTLVGEQKNVEDNSVTVDKSSGIPKQQESIDDLEILISENKNENRKNSEFGVVAVDHGLEVGSRTESVEEKDKGNVLITNENMESAGDNPSKVPHSEQEDNCHNGNCESAVVVLDEFGVAVPAMEFLTNRFLELLRQSENEEIWIVTN